jgi:hypothetical protein
VGAGSHDLMMMKPIAFAICIIMYPIETIMRMMIGNSVCNICKYRDSYILASLSHGTKNC